MERSEQVPLHRLLPALVLAVIPGVLFLRALLVGFFAGCVLDRSANAIGVQAARFGLSAEALFVLPLLLLPTAMAAALSIIALKPSAFRTGTAMLIWLIGLAVSFGAMSIASPPLVGGEPWPHRCLMP